MNMPDHYGPLFSDVEQLQDSDGVVETYPLQLKVMHGYYGLQADKTCGTCAHCIARRWNKTNYYKCTKYGRYSNGPGTDWRKKWAACGAWVKRNKED